MNGFVCVFYILYICDELTSNTSCSKFYDHVIIVAVIIRL